MATIENINFSNIKQPATVSISGVWTHYDNVDANGKYSYDGGKSIMGLDIDWNGATWSSIPETTVPTTINSTSDLLKAIKYASTQGGSATPTYTAASGGPTTDATLVYGESFKVPQVSQSTTGQVTVTNRTLKMPAAVSLNGLIGGAIGTASTPVYWNGSKFVAGNSIPTEYEHPSYTARTSNLYKITVDNKGHVSNAVAVTKSDLLDMVYDLIEAGDHIKKEKTSSGIKIHVTIDQVITYIITWNGNGATSTISGGTTSVNAGNKVTLPSPNPTRSYTITWNNNSGSGASGGSSSATYTFNGWYTATSGGTQVTANTIPTSNVTYYAQWTSPTSITLPSTNPTRSGYTFNGWYTATSGGTQVTANTIPTSNVTYYAQWTAVAKTNPVLTVGNPASTTIADGSTTTVTITSNVSGKLTLTNTSGTGWSATSSSSSTANTTHTITIKNETNVDTAGSISVGGITATFTPTNTTNYNTLTNQSVVKQAIELRAATFTVTFYANGGSITAPAAQTAYIGEYITLPSYSGTRTGYTFAGWAKDAAGTNFVGGVSDKYYGPTTSMYVKWNQTSTEYTYYLAETDQESFTTADFNQTGTKPTSITVHKSTGDTVTIWIYPTSWGKPKSMINTFTNGENVQSWTFNETWLNVPSGYTGAWIQTSTTVTYKITW